MQNDFRAVLKLKMIRKADFWPMTVMNKDENGETER